MSKLTATPYSVGKAEFKWGRWSEAREHGRLPLHFITKFSEDLITTTLTRSAAFNLRSNYINLDREILFDILNRFMFSEF